LALGAPHPDWSGPENEALRQRLAATAETPSKAGVVSFYAIDDGDQVLLFDPLAAPREIIELAADHQPAFPEGSRRMSWQIGMFCCRD
jgi:hypothetical protein